MQSRPAVPSISAVCSTALGFDLPRIDGYRVDLRFARSVKMPQEHGGALRGVLSRSLREHELPKGLMPHALESGKVDYEAGDVYSFDLTLAGEARFAASRLREGLERLGACAPEGPRPLLGGNFVVESWRRLPTRDYAADLIELGDASRLDLTFASPFRLTRPKGMEVPGARYLNSDCFPVDHFLDRLWRRLFLMSRGRYPEADEVAQWCPVMPDGLTVEAGDLVWSDVMVRGTRKKGRPYTLGGVRGTVSLGGLSGVWKLALLLGESVHVGSGTHYGLGRYVLRQAQESVWGLPRAA